MTKLLIVDDSAEMRDLLRSVMKKNCEEIFECADGDEVLAAFSAHQPDWVVMDVEMKRMDGLKATANLLRAHPDANVIILTQHADIETRIAARAAGARFFVSKDDLLDVRLLIEG